MSGLLLQKLCQKSRSSNSSKLGIIGPLFACDGLLEAIFADGFIGSTFVGTADYMIYFGLS